MNRKCRIWGLLWGATWLACSVGGVVRGQSSDDGNPKWMKYGCCPMYYEDEYIRDYARECEENWRTAMPPESAVAIGEDEFVEESLAGAGEEGASPEEGIAVDESAGEGGDYWYDGGTNQYHRYDLADRKDDNPFELAEDDESSAAAEFGGEKYSAEEFPDGGWWPQDDAVEVAEGEDSNPNWPEASAQALGETPARGEDAFDDLFELDRPLPQEAGRFGDRFQSLTDDTPRALAGEPEPAAPTPETLLAVARTLDRLSYLLQGLSQHLMAMAEQELAKAPCHPMSTLQR